MSKYTPGPWSAKKHTDTKGLTVSAGGNSIASVRLRDEAEANARLIAAAPELLEALRLLRESCTEAYKAGRIGALPFVLAGNVIAKATGE